MAALLMRVFCEPKADFMRVKKKIIIMTGKNLSIQKALEIIIRDMKNVYSEFLVT